MNLLELINEVGEALNEPATCWEEVRVRIERNTGERVSMSYLRNAVAYLRRNAAVFGWTIHHSTSGPPRAGVNRLSKLVRGSSDVYGIGDERREMIRRGGVATYERTSRQLANLIESFKLWVPYERSPARQRELRWIVMQSENVHSSVRVLADSLVNDG